MSTPFGQLLKDVQGIANGQKSTNPGPAPTNDAGKNLTSYMKNSIASRNLPEQGNHTINSQYPNLRQPIERNNNPSQLRQPSIDKKPMSSTNKTITVNGIPTNSTYVPANTQSTYVNPVTSYPSTVIQNQQSTYIPGQQNMTKLNSQSTYVPANANPVAQGLMGVINQSNPTTAPNTYNMPTTSQSQFNPNSQSQFNPITATNAKSYDQYGMFSLNKTFNPENNLANFQNNAELKANDPTEYVGKLERQQGDHRVEGGHLKKQLMDLESRHADLGTQYTMLSTEFSNLRREYDALCAVKGELHATQLEQEKCKSEKDFHHEQHLMLRRDLLNQLNKDYENDQLKREKHFVENELRACKEKSLCLEKQIEALLVFAQKPKENEEGGREFFFAKKIVKLEDELEKITGERNQFAFDCEQLKGGIRAINHNAEDSKFGHSEHETLNDTRIDGGTDGLLEQLKHLKRKNDMLTKENQLIRKELDSNQLNKKVAPSEQFNQDHYLLEDLKQENQNLRQKVDKFQKTIAEGVSNLGGHSDRFELLVEQQKIELMKLREENAVLRVQGPGSTHNNMDDRLTKEISSFYEKIALLERDNEELRRRSSIGNNNNNTDVVKLQKRNKILEEENKTMKVRIELLQKKLDEREMEIRQTKLGDVHCDDGARVNPEELQNLMAANEKLMKQINKMQGQINRHDSMAGFQDMTDYSIADYGNHNHRY